MSSQPRPILVLQMQRMGDLVLSFPLCLWLARVYPGHPIWVVAEPSFYNGLIPLSPQVTYFPWTATAQLKKHQYHLIVNLSHRPEAAMLCGMLESEEKIGPLEEANGVRRIRGGWQLYRASIVQNNRHNRFHFADLNALDVIPKSVMKKTRWILPKHKTEHARSRVGVFVGASQPEKRPDIELSAALINALYTRGVHTVLFGGPGEKQLGKAIEQAASGHTVNTCGKLTLAELFKVVKEMDLFITPDTGPMHVAAWAGIPVLNLSMGPVNPWDTGPYQPGHYVLRAAVSCLGCWDCAVDGAYCRPRFHPEKIASLVRRLLSAKDGIRFRTPRLRLFSTARDADGLYDMIAQAGGERDQTLRDQVALFWKAWFAEQLGRGATMDSHTLLHEFTEQYPALTHIWRQQMITLGTFIKKGVAFGSSAPERMFWNNFIPLLRPLTGYLQLTLENSDYSQNAWKKSLHLYAQLADRIFI